MSDTTIDFTANVDDTTVCYADLIAIGTAVLNSVTASQMLRHTSPSGLVEYVTPEDDLGALVLLDLLRWVRPAGDAIAEARLVRFVETTGWADAQRRGASEGVSA
jgi:hypothetical protein